MRYRRIAGALVLTVSGAIAAPSTAKELWLPEVADSAGLSGPPVAAGTLRAPGGSRFAKGTQVVLYALPSTAVTDLLTVGDSISLSPVAKAYVGASGRFSLRVEDLAALERYADGRGHVDLEVFARDGGYAASWSFSRAYAPATNSRQTGLRHIDPAAQRLTPSATGLDVRSRGRVRASVDTEFANIVAADYNPDVAAAAKRADRVGGAAMNKTDVCGQTLVRNLGSRHVITGETYALPNKTKSEFVFEQGSNSSLEVGFSATGTYGSYSGSGKVSRTSTDTISYGLRNGGKRYGTYFRYGKYSQWCHPVWDPDDKSIYGYKVRANKFEGGSTVATSSAPSTPMRYCRDFSAGTNYTKDDSSARSWTKGAKLHNVIGINLSARTGFTSKAKVISKNTGSVTRRLCGAKDVVGGSPRRIVTRKKT